MVPIDLLLGCHKPSICPNVVSSKCNEVKLNEMRYVCTFVITADKLSYILLSSIFSIWFVCLFFIYTYIYIYLISSLGIGIHFCSHYFFLMICREDLARIYLLLQTFQLFPFYLKKKAWTCVSLLMLKGNYINFSCAKWVNYYSSVFLIPSPISQILLIYHYIK